MFDDPKKELRQLEKQLLRAELPEEAAETEDFDELYEMLREKLSPEDDPDIYYDDPDTSANLRDEEFYDKYAQRPPERENLTGLVVTACLLTLGIVAVALWWVVKLF